MSDLQPQNNQPNVMREGVDKLAGGLLQEYEPTLKTLQTHLNELTNKQQQLVTQVETENMRLKRIEKEELKDMCRVIKSYQIRLQNIKKDMILLSGRSLKLKNRAIKLHRLKQNEALEREQQREAQLTREQELIAKPSNKS